MRLTRIEGRKNHKKYWHIRTSRVQEIGNQVNSCCQLSKHLATTEVRATGQKSFIALVPFFFGIGLTGKQHADLSATGKAE